MKKHLPIFVLLIIYFIYSFLSYKNFGITWDEQAVYERGKMLYQHLIDPDYKTNVKLLKRESETDVWPTYNNAYATVLYAFNKEQSYDRYHLLNMIFTSVIFVFSYFFIYKKYKNVWEALLAPLFIILNPRFFGAIPANPKDIPFAIFYFVSIASVYLTSSTKNVFLRVLILGILFGFSQSTRTIGLTLYPILFLYDLCFNKNSPAGKGNLFQKIVNEFIYVFLIFITSNWVLITTWPYIGSNYFKNLFDIISTSKQFPWVGTIFFLGKNYQSAHLTPLYIPIWLFVGMPIFLVLLSLLSFYFIKRMVKNPVFFLSLAVIGINIFMYFFLRPIVYDGMRHFLFLLPFFSILAVLSFIEIGKLKSKKIKQIINVFILINCLLVIATQIKLFPYQYVYFNEFVGGLSGGQKYFETDYWNSSFREGILWLKENEIKKDKKYGIYTCSSSWSLLRYFDLNMTWAKNYKDADYAICYTRYAEYKKIPGKIIHIVERQKVPLTYVIKLKK